MRMVKIKNEALTLEQVAERFLLVKEAQHTGLPEQPEYHIADRVSMRHGQNGVAVLPVNRYFVDSICQVI